jgi:NADH-quinone oxidoreductase subunit L
MAVERPLSVVPEALAAPGKEIFEEALHHAHGTAMALSLLVAGIGILVAFATYYWKRINADAVADRLAPVHGFLMNKWGFDDLYNTVVVDGTLAFTRGLRWVDDTIIDGTVNGAGWLTTVISFVSGKFDAIVVDGMVNLMAYLSGFIGLVFRKVQTGKVQTYVLFAVFSVLILYFVFRVV